MIRSMTGFGSAESKYPGGKITVELKAVNHRFFELSSRLSNHISLLEDKIRGYINTKIKRGRVNLNLTVEDSLGYSQAVSINKTMAKKYFKSLNELKKELGIKAEISLEQLVMLPEVLTGRSAVVDTEKVWPHIKTTLDVALAKLIKAREREGAELEKDLLDRIHKIEGLVENIQKQVPSVIAAYKRNLKEKIEEIASSVKLDAGRLEIEVAVFAKNCDISEEVTRMLAHIKNFKEVLSASGEAGRQLDFISQELFRETNTIGAKSQDIKIAKSMIQMKEEIEKIREQLQNVE